MELKLPDLRIVSCSRLVLHEESDPVRVRRICRRLESEGVLGNPPIVGEIRGRSRLVVLDGANRVSAALALGLETLMVQVVDYSDPGIRLTRWHHLLIDLDPDHLVKALKGIPQAKTVRLSKQSGETVRTRGRSACDVRLVDGTTYTVKAVAGRSSASVMRDVTGIYKKQTQIYRIADEQIDLLADKTHANVTAVVQFPRFRKADIVRIALDEGEKLPPGITKHYIPNRALKVNLPLTVLRGRDDLKSKSKRLEEWIARKSREKRIRAYPEPTVIFDE